MAKEYITTPDDFPSIGDVIERAIPPDEEANAQIEETIEEPAAPAPKKAPKQRSKKAGAKAPQNEQPPADEIDEALGTEEKEADASPRCREPLVAIGSRMHSAAHAALRCGLIAAGKFATGTQLAWDQLKSKGLYIAAVTIGAFVALGLFSHVQPKASFAQSHTPQPQYAAEVDELSIAPEPAEPVFVEPDSVMRDLIASTPFSQALSKEVQQRLIEDFCLYWNNRDVNRLYMFMGPIAQQYVNRRSFNDQCQALFPVGEVTRCVFRGYESIGEELGGEVYELTWAAQVGYMYGTVKLTLLYDSLGMQVLRFDIRKGD